MIRAILPSSRFYFCSIVQLNALKIYFLFIFLLFSCAFLAFHLLLACIMVSRFFIIKNCDTKNSIVFAYSFFIYNGRKDRQKNKRCGFIAIEKLMMRRVYYFLLFSIIFFVFIWLWCNWDNDKYPVPFLFFILIFNFFYFLLLNRYLA